MDKELLEQIDSLALASLEMQRMRRGEDFYSALVMDVYLEHLSECIDLYSRVGPDDVAFQDIWSQRREYLSRSLGLKNE